MVSGEKEQLKLFNNDYGKLFPVLIWVYLWHWEQQGIRMLFSGHLFVVSDNKMISYHLQGNFIIFKNILTSNITHPQKDLYKESSIESLAMKYRPNGESPRCLIL